MISPFAKSMASGRIVDLSNPTEHDIDFRDVAEALAKLCRFTGATNAHYSVAQHSVLVAQICPPHLSAYALLHDAHEAYTGDIATPMKRLINYEAEKRVIETIEARFDAAIYKAAGLPWPLGAGEMTAIKAADQMAFIAESYDLTMNHFTSLPLEDRPARPPIPKIKPMSWVQAHDTFIAALRTLFPRLDLDRRYQ